MSDYDIAIIGGGLAGLTAATLLHQRGRDIIVIEASNRLGGRIDSVRDENGHPIADLGPTWVWPPYQPSADHWIKTLKLETFAQFNTGDAVIDIDQNQSFRQPLPGQHGIARIAGGPQAFVDAMAATLPANRIQLEMDITAISASADHMVLHHAKGRLSAHQVIVAAPLRRVAHSIDWSDLLPEDMRAFMREVSTWMANQIKVAAIYDAPFWRQNGLSGRIASRIGPMGEVHDISATSGSPAALFGFVADSAYWRGRPDLDQAIRTQLRRSFGTPADAPASLSVRDWGANPFICTQLDRDRPQEHPSILPDLLRQPFAAGRLHFCVAETAQVSPGLIDGALESGMRAADLHLATQD